jgi:hypothetical protein
MSTYAAELEKQPKPSDPAVVPPIVKKRLERGRARMRKNSVPRTAELQVLARRRVLVHQLEEPARQPGHALLADGWWQAEPPHPQQVPVHRDDRGGEGLGRDPAGPGLRDRPSNIRARRLRRRPARPEGRSLGLRRVAPAKDHDPGLHPRPRRWGGVRLPLLGLDGRPLHRRRPTRTPGERRSGRARSPTRSSRPTRSTGSPESTSTTPAGTASSRQGSRTRSRRCPASSALP